VALEQENREVKSGDESQRLMSDYLARYQKDPGNTRLVRSIADLSVKQKDYPKALEFFQILAAGEQGNDASLQKEVTRVQALQIDQQIEQLDQGDVEYQEKLRSLESARRELVLNAARRRVDQYPNDLQLRFELGQLLFQSNRISEAIQEFQKSQANPNRKLQSMYHLGLCFSQRNMNDLALRSLQNALKEKPVMDEEKKDIVYALGNVLQKMGKVDEAIEQFKQIYEVDIGYKDVAAKVDEYYAGQ
jgi:tetratricopeptide (TPR) repeat protein